MNARLGIAELAERNGRSMNAEVVARLEASFEQDESQKTIDELQADAEMLQGIVKGLEARFDAYKEERQNTRMWMLHAVNAVAHGEPIPPLPGIEPDET